MTFEEALKELRSGKSVRRVGMPIDEVLLISNACGYNSCCK